MNTFRRWLLLIVVIVVGSGIFAACQDGTHFVRGIEIKQREHLIGGPMALGKVGDFLLENSQVRIVISRHGISSAFGLFGGNIVDADRVRAATARGNSAGGRGFDTLVEMFPLFFLATVDSKDSKVVCDGKGACEGYEANTSIVRVTGSGASFISLTEKINDLLLFMGGKNRLEFQVDYILRPNKNYLEIKTTLRNPTESSYVYQTFGGAVPAVAGMVGLFGKRNSVFIPGIAGHNLRFSLEHAFANEVKLEAPAIPGLVGDFVGSRGHGGVSYGLVAKRSEDNYVYKYKDEFAKLDGKPKLNDGSLVVPLEGSSITACFTKNAPTVLKKKGDEGDSFSYTLYFVIGDGSVSSIRDSQLEIHERDKGLVSGQLFEKDTHNPVAGATVAAYTRNGEGNTPGKRLFYTEFVTDSQGRFRGYMEPGEYFLLARHRKIVSEELKVKVEKDAKANVMLELPRPGILVFNVRDEKGRLLPAKVTAIASVGDFDNGRCVGKHPIYCMFDPHIGAPNVPTDFKAGLACADGTACRNDATCKAKKADDRCFYRLKADTEYREDFAVSENGRGRLFLRPLPAGKKYRIVASRGMEYELDTKEIEIRAGEVKTVELRVVHSLKTPNMISADLHVHTNLSHDSAIPDRDRVASFAAEGVDYFVTTDHNRVRDLQPIVDALGLERWLKTGVGLELTTFEMGHFNAFPLKVNINEFNGGNPNWFKLPGIKEDDRYTENVAFPEGDSPRPVEGLRKGIAPKELFNKLRDIGKISPEQTIIQINHPRDSIFGYFNTYNLSPDHGRPVALSSGLTTPNSREFDVDKYENNFDAIEIYNGKRVDLNWHWRLPPNTNPPSGYGGTTNTIIRLDNEGKADVASPGGGDDWFNMLNAGKAYTATANSDTHDLSHEAGVPRNYFLTGFDDPQKMTDQLLVDLIRKHKVIMTNGPLLEMFGSTKESGPFQPIGEILKAAKGTIYIKISVRAASWVSISDISIFQNGRLAKQITVDENKKDVNRFEGVFPFTIERDSWFVAIAKGNKSLWPVIRPDEVEPFQIGEAVSLIQETLLSNLPISLSFGQSACLLPAQARLVAPYAITNPIWFDTDGDGKYTPDPCKTLGTKGIRCYKKGSSCKDAMCLDPSLKCGSEGSKCPNYSQCIDGVCTIDACKGITCSKAFQKCDNDTVCANDQCPEDARRCSDGTSCKEDKDCAGKGDGYCRYCACPPARKACSKDGSPCQSDTDCADKGKCETGRYCQPTACALGYCEYTFPVCTDDNVTKHEYAYLRKLNASMPKKAASTPEDAKIQRLQKKDAYTIHRARSFFLFFEHRH